MSLFGSILDKLGLSVQGSVSRSGDTVIRPPTPETEKPTHNKPPPHTKSSDIDWHIGDRILARYEVRDIKKGGFGYVFLCYDHQHGMPVAIKTLIEKDYTQSGITYQDMLDKFHLEAEAWVRLEKHKNIVQAKGVERIDGKPYIILEYVTGQKTDRADLSGWIEGDALGITRSLDFAVQFCAGMEHAADVFKTLGMPFVHRDIKPANTMVTHDGVVKITDFGLVKIFEGSANDIFLQAGTPPYMAPEQFQGLPDIDVRSDVYSFGCMLYEMLTGRWPFQDNFLYKHIYEAPLAPKDLVPALPNRLNGLVMRCLEKDRDARFQDFSILKRELTKLYEELTGNTVEEETAAELETWERLNKGIALSRLGFRQQAITEYLQVLAGGPRAAAGFIQANLSRTVESYCPEAPPEKLVVYIQSVFSNYSQQKNIAGVLDVLVSKYGLKLIAVEGGSGKIDLEFYRQLPDGPSKEEVARYFLKEARIQGHEYFAINAKQDIAFYGAEEPGLHERHLESYKGSLSGAGRWIACCDTVEKTLTALKPKVYSAELQLFEKQNALLKGQSVQHFFFIRSLLDQLGIQNPYPNLSLFCEANALAQRVNNAQAQREIQELFAFLSGNLKADVKEGFNKAVHDYRKKESSEYQFFRYLHDLISRNFTLSCLEGYPHLARYMEYVRKRGEVKVFDLMAIELESAEEAIKENLYRTEDQGTLDELLKHVRLLKIAYAAKLTPPQFAYLEKNRSAISGQRIADFITRKASESGLNLVDEASGGDDAFVLPADTAHLGEHLWRSDGYYFQAVERGRKLVQNCLKYMEDEGEAGGILVAGGFHSHVITAHLRQQGIPYLVLAPVYELSDEDEQRYLGAITDRKTPLEVKLGGK